MAPKLPWYARLVLLRPKQIEENLERIRAARIVERTPNSWQIFLGVARMWHRMVFHPETIGATDEVPVRASRRARLLDNRVVRFPFLVWERSIAPLDLSGLASPPARVRKHLLGTYHSGDGAVYDLRLLSYHPGELEGLRDELRALLRADSRRLRWLRDLCVYDGYHEELLAQVERAIEGDYAVQERDHTDSSLEEYLTWCASRPQTPAETWRALREGRLGLNAPAPTGPARPKEETASAAAEAVPA